jgi:LysR family transcriptional regulator, transcription activator of glutamate synthase operon
VLRDYAEKLLALEEEARRSVRAVVGLERGQLRIWTLPTPGQHLLPPLLAEFRQRYPQIEIFLHERVPSLAVAEGVASGQADLGIVHLPCAVRGLTMGELLTEELALVVPSGHLLVGSEPPTLAQLSEETFVWVPDGQSVEHPIYAACLAAGFVPKIACVSGSAGGMQALVAAGLGIALLPRLAITRIRGVEIIELAMPRPTRTLAVVHREDALSHAAAAFYALLIDSSENQQ